MRTRSFRLVLSLVGLLVLLRARFRPAPRPAALSSRSSASAGPQAETTSSSSSSAPARSSVRSAGGGFGVPPPRPAWPLTARSSRGRDVSRPASTTSHEQRRRWVLRCGHGREPTYGTGFTDGGGDAHHTGRRDDRDRRPAASASAPPHASRGPASRARRQPTATTRTSAFGVNLWDSRATMCRLPGPEARQPAEIRLLAGRDAAPCVSITSPANGATDVAPTANVSVTFSEPVTVTGAAFALSCATAARTRRAVRRPDDFTLDPTTTSRRGDLHRHRRRRRRSTDATGDPPPMAATTSVHVHHDRAAPAAIHDIQGASHLLARTTTSSCRACRAS